MFRSKLLNVHPGARTSSLRELSKTPFLRHVEFDKVVEKEIAPPFRPPADHLNCDPSLELEEMIVEAKPLHKKKKRLAKQRSAQKDSADSSTAESNFIKEFIVYNRYKEIKKRAMEMKEREWQEELNTLMANSEVNNLSCIREIQNEHQQTSTATSTTINNRSSIRKNTEKIETTSPPALADAKGSDSIEFIDRTPSPKQATLSSKK